MRRFVKIFIIFLSFFFYYSLSSFCQTHDSLWYERFGSLSLNEKLKDVSSENPAFKISFYNIDSINNITDIRFNFFFSKKAIKAMQDDFIKKDSLNKSNIIKEPKIKNDNNTTLLFKNVKLKWDDSYNALVSSDTMVLYQLNEVKTNKIVKCIIWFRENKVGWEIIFFISDDNNFGSSFYFFHYKNNLLQSISNNMEFNKTIINTRPNHRTINRHKEKQPYIYTISSYNHMKMFRKMIDNIRTRINNEW
jgi:hypothetical protein